VLLDILEGLARRGPGANNAKKMGREFSVLELPCPVEEELAYINMDDRNHVSALEGGLMACYVVLGMGSWSGN
jgi:hypothetical protein